MIQSRRVSPSEAIQFTESLPNRAGVLEDLSSATLKAQIVAPSGTESTFSVVGTSAGEMTLSGTLENQEGTHKAYLWVNGELRKELHLVARGPEATATGTSHITITADRTTITVDML